MLPQYPPIVDSRKEPFSWEPLQFRLKHLLIFVTVVACGLAFLRAAYIGLTHVETGENVEHVKWLPKSASNVSYLRSYSFTAFEFDISESDFMDWSGWKLQQISGPVRITRYCFSNHADFGPNPSPEEIEAWENRNQALITDGLYYEHRQSNGGGVRVGYDRDKGRAFFQSSPR
jgi:hypothetical protein